MRNSLRFDSQGLGLARGVEPCHDDGMSETEKLFAGEDITNKRAPVLPTAHHNTGRLSVKTLPLIQQVYGASRLGATLHLDPRATMS